MSDTFMFVTIFLYCRYDYWCHQYLAGLGIPGPWAKPVIGHMGDWMFAKKVRRNLVLKVVRKKPVLT